MAPGIDGESLVAPQAGPALGYTLLLVGRREFGGSRFRQREVGSRDVKS